MIASTNPRLSLPLPNLKKIKYLGHVVRVLGQGQTDTDRHTDIPRTDQRLKTYEIFLISPEEC